MTRIKKRDKNLIWRHDTQHNSVEGYYAECRDFIVMLSVIMENVIMLSVVMLSVIM